jgi:hypothetical protein
MLHGLRLPLVWAEVVVAVVALLMLRLVSSWELPQEEHLD